MTRTTEAGYGHGQYNRWEDIETIHAVQGFWGGGGRVKQEGMGLSSRPQILISVGWVIEKKPRLTDEQWCSRVFRLLDESWSYV